MPNMNTNFKVRNINGTGKNPYSSSQSKTSESWLQTWRDETKSDRATCCVIGCSNTAQVGAHVQVVDGRTDGTWYLAPFCKKCNHTTNIDHMFLDSRVVLVALRPDMR